MTAWIRYLVCGLVISLLTSTAGPQAFGTEVEVSSTQVGAFYGPYLPTDDPPAGYPAVPPPDNDPAFQNYFMGRSTISGFTTSERRVFFFYDMAGVAASIPAGEEVIHVEIDLKLLEGGTSALANFTDDHEIVEFTATSATVDEILDPVEEGVAPEDVWATFGMGTPYGGFELLGPDVPLPDVPTMAGTHVIDLPGAVEDAKSAIGSGSILIVTARLATFDPGPIGMDAPPPDDPYEYVFGVTDVVTPGGSPTVPAPILTLTTALVPEPSTLFLLLVAILATAVHRRATIT